MSKELEKEATDYAEKHHMTSYFAQADVYVDDKKEIINAILCFAEPREKRIADLEQLNSNQAESLRVIMLEEEKKRKRIEELEKENAELRAKYLQATDEGTSFAHLKSLEWKNTKLNNQLTKAKEIIKELLNSYKYVIRFREYANKKPIADAEQFLKEQ